MKKLLIPGLLFLVACNINSPKQKRIENLVKIYLDSINKNVPNYEIIRFSDLHANSDPFDHPNYEKYKNFPLKLDSLRRNYKPKITGWVIYVTFRGKNYYGNFGIHKFMCAINGSLSKCVAGIEIEK